MACTLNHSINIVYYRSVLLGHMFNGARRSGKAVIVLKSDSLDLAGTLSFSIHYARQLWFNHIQRNKSRLLRSLQDEMISVQHSVSAHGWAQQVAFSAPAPFRGV
jgi:hypothetical protein